MEVLSMRLLMVCFSFLILIGCSTPYKPEPFIQKDGSGEIYSSDTSAISTTHVRTIDGRRVVCMAPPPDSSFSSAVNSGLQMSIIRNDDNSKDSEGSSASANESELAGRSPSLLITREVLYRTCEVSDNFDLTKEEAIKLFSKSMEIVDKNWAAAAANTTITITDGVTETNQAAIANVVEDSSSATASNDQSE
jgi:hypothetical protein